MIRTSHKLVCLFLMAGLMQAQTFVASISGTVRDASGGFVPGVKVSVRDTTTNVGTVVTTDGGGNYTVPFLKPSTYQVSFEKAGFDKSVTESFSLVMNQKLRLDMALKTGSIAQSITVEEHATQLNRVTSDISGEIGSEDLVNLPGLSGFTFARIFPGVAGSSPSFSNINNFSLGGGRPVTNPIIIDGLPSTMGADGTYGFVPTPDSTEEMQVLTAPFSAQYGQTGGGVILSTTKTGGNDIHGSLFEYHSNQHMNALSFFSSANTLKPVSISNYFGGSVGGPVYIPHLWNGRKTKTYFFTTWEETLSHSAKLLNQTVPTPAELQGNFTGPTPLNTPAFNIYDPNTTQVTSGKITRQAFPGNIIPASRIDPVGARMAAFYPAPNCAFNQFNYCVDPPGNKTYLYNTDRLDQNFGDMDRVWARFGRDGPTTFAVPYIENAANPNALNGWRDYQAGVTWHHIFSPRLANEFRVGFVEENNFTSPETANVSSLGLQGVPLTQFPTLSVTGIYGLGSGTYSRSEDRHWIFNDALVTQRGRHNLQMGFEFMRYINKVFQPGVLSGGYSFTGIFTSAAGAAGTIGLSDLLLGMPASASVTSNNYQFRYRLNYASSYIQDDYKLTSRLTINLGLRWEFDGPYKEVNGQNYSFNPNLTDTTTGARGAVQFAGINGAPSHFVPNNYKGFLPRAGFAYSLGPNTVFRGGYGIYQLPSIGFMTNGQTSKYSVAASFPNVGGVTPPFLLSQGVPPYSPNVGPNGLPNIVASLTKPSANVQMLTLAGTIPYNQEWQIGIQQQFGHGWFAEIDYAGNRGVHLPITVGINQIHPIPGCCNGLSTAQSLRPYPQFLNVNEFQNEGNANYNALQAKLQHYWRSGLMTVFAYTWAKIMDDADAAAKADGVPIQNSYNLKVQYGVAMIDIPQRFSASWVWDIPVGAGGKVLSHVPVVNQAIGHWQVGGLAEFGIGYPYQVTQSNQMGLFNGAQYVNKVGDPVPAQRTLAAWFNPAAFQAAPPNTFGNAPRASLFGPGLNQWDLSLARIFPITEKFRLKIRAEAGNAFNHPEWSNLNTTITSPALGSVTSSMNSRGIQVSARVAF